MHRLHVKLADQVWLTCVAHNGSPHATCSSQLFEAILIHSLRLSDENYLCPISAQCNTSADLVQIAVAI